MSGTDKVDGNTGREQRLRRVLRDANLALADSRPRVANRTAIGGRTVGTHRARGTGGGSEPGDARSYKPGDDPRHIDWNATARAAELVVRNTVAERALRVLTIVDASRSMFHGTRYATKNELAVGAVALIAQTTARQGDLIGGYYGAAKPVWIPGGGGSRHAWTNIRAARALTPSPVEFATVLTQASTIIKTHTSTVIILSDFHDATLLYNPIRRLAATHHVLCVRIEDPSERDLVDIGHVQFAGAERGRKGRIDTTNPAVRAAYAEQATALASSRETVLRKAGAHVATLRCGPLWARSLSATLNRQT
jgi:uncharacterized protein (DUF58 family)